MSGLDIVFGDPSLFIDTNADVISRALLISPYFYGVIGLTLCISLSVVGSAWYRFIIVALR